MNILDLSNSADRHLGRILELQAAQNGDTQYLIADDQRITYAEANATCDRLAAGFKALGVDKGDRVMLF
ncbi:MAG: AMP-binding protein, partial [Halioglobus sp.]|nr:AMP-binding protein [Halioglobus sp.]